MTSRKRKNWLKYIIMVVILVGLAIGGFMIWEHWQTKEVREEDKTVQPAEVKEKDVEVKEDEDKTEARESLPADVGKEKVEQFDGGDPNEKDGLTGVITYAGVSGGNLMIRVNIDQYLTGGTCKLNLSREGRVIYEETAEVTDSAATATCKGFNVSVADLGSGKINIKILVTSGEKTGTIEGEVNL